MRIACLTPGADHDIRELGWMILKAGKTFNNLVHSRCDYGMNPTEIQIKFKINKDRSNYRTRGAKNMIVCLETELLEYIREP